MGKASDDNYRPNPDSEANSARYPPQTTTICHTALLEDSLPPTGAVPSSSIRVGDLVLLEKNQRVPANLVLRKDKLDGETGWKLSAAVPETQKLPSDQELLNLDAEIHRTSMRLTVPTFSVHTPVSAADAPTKDIDSSMKVKS
jgi:phospholipid-translocating ATPase